MSQLVIELNNITKIFIILTHIFNSGSEIVLNLRSANLCLTIE